MPRKKNKKTAGHTPLRVNLFAGFLVLVVLVGIGTVKLFQTTHGKIILLDAGLTHYYDTVQQELDAELRERLRTASQKPDSSLVLKADKDVPYGFVIRAMDISRQCGIRRIVSLTQVPRPEK